MKKIILILVACITFTAVYGQGKADAHYVNGYYRSDGVYVQPHYRKSNSHITGESFGIHPKINHLDNKTEYVYTVAEAYSYDLNTGNYSFLISNQEINIIEINGSSISITLQNGRKKTFICEWKVIEGTRCLVEGDNESIFLPKDGNLMWFFIFDGIAHQSLIVFK